MKKENINEILFGNSITAYLQLIQKQESIVKKISPFAGITDSLVQQIQKSHEVNRINSKLNPFASLTTSINLYIEEKKLQDKLWKPLDLGNQISRLISSVNYNQSLYDKFYSQNNSIATVINPSISSFIKSNVRTRFEQNDSINTIEAIYLDSFESFREEYTDTIQTEIDEFSEVFENNTNLKNDILSLFKGFKGSFLGNELSEAIENILSKYFGKKSKIFIVTITCLFFINLNFIQPYLDSVDETKWKEGVKNTSQKQERKLIELDKNEKLEDNEIRDKEKLHQYLNSTLEKFEKNKLSKLGKRTVKRYTQVASTFIDYIYNHTQYKEVKEIRLNNIEIEFISSVKYNDLNEMNEKEIKTKLKSFLNFLFDNYE